MDLNKNGRLIRDLRKARGMTQKEVAESLGVLPKTVSKWETGHGFPDVSAVSCLSEILGVDEKTLLSGSLTQNPEEVGNMKKTKFYVCPKCGGFLWGGGESNVSCCGHVLKPLEAKAEEEGHKASVLDTENDFYVSFGHEMTKEHYISFAAYVCFDRVLVVRLYPEQDSAVRFPKMYGGKLYFYCNNHGMFVHAEQKDKNEKSGNTSLTAVMSAFSRAYHFENAENPVFCDSAARKMFSDEEYESICGYITEGGRDAKQYVNTFLAPTPLARARFCEDSLAAAVKSGAQQYVILASGFDTFSLRNENDSLKVFEVDKKAVLDDKKQRLKRAGIKIPDNACLVPCDLASGNLYSKLVRNGFDKNKKTVISCLGLLYYLTAAEIDRLFEQIAGVCCEGSEVIFDFADSHLFSSGVPRVKVMLEAAEKSGEPMKSCFGYSELEKLLEKHGFLIYEFLNDKDIQERYFNGRNDGLTAFEHINYALAVLK